ncbi:MAG: CDP-diglyceride synthetase [Bacteroidetes bacterium]|jgi:phosphatidate cytidylyltransferase|nr:CDP-diglyceride synthetase [Bacteroidota bacterium]
MAFDSKKFLIRTGSAAVFVVVLLGCIFWNYYSFSLLFFVVSMWGLHEFYKLMEINGNKPQRFVGFAVGGLGYLFTFITTTHSQIVYQYFENPHNTFYALLHHLPELMIAAMILLCFLSPLIELFRNKEKPFENLSITFFGIAYVVLPMVLLNMISTTSHSNITFSVTYYKPTFILSIFLLIWSNDTFAYLCGSFIGKNKMFERISPGKTWEGTIGGGILTIAVSFLIWKLFGLLQLQDWIIISVIVVIFGTLGDLVESMLKRSVDVKDSGKIMPGHGGILDRFDSLIMVAPFVFLYLILK